MEEEGRKNTSQRKGPDKSEIPDLALTMQEMSLAEPGLCRVQGNQVMKQEEVDFSCCLLLKVACTGGSPRIITHQALKQSMERAWKEKFHGISQVSSSVFAAHFKSKEDMISVYIKQPWVANSENLLLEWFDPHVDAFSSDDYKFDTILVTVRAYGIPRNKRSINLLKNILNQVGEVSDFHILQDTNLFAKQDYIFGTAKMMVHKPVKDRAQVSFEDDTSLVAYLHYEKIKRACLFCGILFHNAQDCNIRNRLVSERQRKRQSSVDIPAQRYGQWIINDSYIPEEIIHSTRREGHILNQQGNAIMNRLKDIFEQNSKGKGKASEISSENPTLVMPQGEIYRDMTEHNPSTAAGRLHCTEQTIARTEDTRMIPLPTTVEHTTGQQVIQQGIASSSKCQQEAVNNPMMLNRHASEANLTSPRKETQTEGNTQGKGISGQNSRNSTQISQNLQQGQTSNMLLLSPRMSSYKRAVPTEELSFIPSAKKPMAEQNNQERLSILQCASRAAPPYNPELSLSQNAEFMNRVLGIQNSAMASGILGAPPVSMQPHFTSNASMFDPRIKNKQSRWDMQAQNQLKSGANTWKRNVAAANTRKNQMPRSSNVTPHSPCRSDANSGTVASYEHDPWPLHTPQASYSQGTADSRSGAFSQPQMARELYEMSSRHEEGFQRAEQGTSAIQAGRTQNMSAQDQEALINNTTDTEALAPAFKAPRAP